VPVVVITAAAHRAGKRIADHLVDDGWDVAFWGLDSMRTRVATAIGLGRQAIAVKRDILDPMAVRVMVDETRETFPAVDAIVHIAADHLAIADDGSDPATAAALSLGAVHVVYLGEPGWDATATTAWCGARQVEVTVLDKTDKVHNLAPAVRGALSG
jgi:NAD(P)-dependent dehydrogenase (short-subunit alcohol dehydrogenase family)